MTAFPRVALVIDDIVEAPAKNGVTARFVEMARRVGFLPSVTPVIFSRGGSDPVTLRRHGITGVMIPSPWLYGPEYREKILPYLRRLRPDIVHVCNAHGMAPRYGFKLAQDLEARLAIDMHDVTSELLATPELKATEDVQQRYIAEMADLVFVVSSHDYRLLREMRYPMHKLRHAATAMSTRIAGVPGARGERVAFLGNLYYPPNREAAHFLVRRVAPLIRSPTTEILIIGPVSAAEGARLSGPRVKVFGAVDDLRGALSSARAAAAPILVGSGMKVKILDYAAAELPVVCTPLAARGYEGASGLIVCESAEDFAANLSNLLAQPERSEALGRAFGAAMAAEFSWEKTIEAVLDGYRASMGWPRIVKPRIEVEDGQGFLLDGITFPPPLHLGEARYRGANSVVQSVTEL